MEFDVRYRDFTFKHTFASKPDLNSERYREHYHTTYELLYFVQGNADFMLQHTLYKIKPGSLLIAKPGEYHHLVLHSDAPYERYVIRFSPMSVYPYVRKQLDKTETVYYIQGTPLEAEFRRMDSHVTAVHKDVLLSACIGSMNIINAYLISSQDLIQKADYVNEDTRTIIQYIDTHLFDIRTVGDIAQALHMSRSSIYKLFTKQFDTPIMSYIRTQKCMIARDLLAEGESASIVARRLGFKHYSSFYRNYSSVFHAAPTEIGVNPMSE